MTTSNTITKTDLANILNEVLPPSTGNEYTYVTASSGITGGLRLFKDKASGTIRAYGYFRRSTNISQSETIFQLPTGWSPIGGWEIPMFFYTSGGAAAAYYGILGTDGTIKQSLGSTIREGFTSFEYTL